MRVLRLSDSDDLDERFPPEQRVGGIAERVMREELGIPIETVIRATWATDDLPARVDKWLDQYQPDFVLLKVNWYWYGYESVPLRIERVLGKRVGRPIARLGLFAADSRPVGTSRPFKLLRRATHRVIGGDSPFTAEHVIRVMEACIRVVIAREDVVLLVKGVGRTGDRDDPATGHYVERFSRKVDLVQGTLRQRCAELHVAWTDARGAPTLSTEDADLAGGDGIHRGLRGYQRVGESEGRAMAAAWRAATGP